MKSPLMVVANSLHNKTRYIYYSCRECELERWRQRAQKSSYKKKLSLYNKKRRKIKEVKFKIQQRDKLRVAVRSGKIIKKSCLECGENKTQAHHPDYAKPLEVIWLCTTCHANQHRKML